MLRGAASLLALVATAPVMAQDERTRLDDFAIATGNDASAGEVEQVGSVGSPLVAFEQTADRSVDLTQSTVAPTAPIGQLSKAGDESAPQQLSRARQAPARVTSVSDRADGKPQGLQRLSGNDRCDPQLPEAQLAQCLTILERRAGEFNAREAPVLSAEERLLAEQKRDDAELAGISGDMRVRLASLGQPDADLRSNQELAAIVLEGPKAPEPAASAPDQEAETLADALRGLAIQIQQAGIPTGN